MNNRIRQFIPNAMGTEVPMCAEFDTGDVLSLLGNGFVLCWMNNQYFKEFHISSDGTMLLALIQYPQEATVPFTVGIFDAPILPGGKLIMPQEVVQDSH